MGQKYAIVKFLDEETPVKLDEMIHCYEGDACLRMKPRSYRNIVRYLRHLREFCGDVSAQAVGKVEVGKFSAWLKARYKNNVVRNHLGSANNLYAHGLANGQVSKNPFAFVALPPAERGGRALTNAEIDVLTAHLAGEYRDVVRFMLYTGIRCGEAASMDWDQLTADVLTIPANKSKNGVERKILLSARAVALLPPSRKNGKVYAASARSIQRHFAAARAEWGLGAVRPHDCRHTWATRFWEATNGDAKALKEQGGWVSESYLLYQHVSRQRAQAGQEAVANSYGVEF